MEPERDSPDAHIACRDCDALYPNPELEVGQVARCQRCGGLLIARNALAIERTFALTLAAIVLFALANAFPFMAFESKGLSQEITLGSSIASLFENRQPLLATTIFLVILGFPAFSIAGLLYVSAPLHFGHVPPFAAGLGRWLHYLKPWGMMEVFLVGVLVSLVKLTGMATIVLGISFWAFVALILVLIAAASGLDRHEFWQAIDGAQADV